MGELSHPVLMRKQNRDGVKTPKLTRAEKEEKRGKNERKINKGKK